MLVHITEIIGSRQSGRTTKLYEEIKQSLKENPNKVHVIISTDIKIREVFDVTVELGIKPTVVTINPLHKNGNFMCDRTVTKMCMEDILSELKNEYVFAYVDNITLPMTHASLLELSVNAKVTELFYTGIMFHFGKGRNMIKNLFDIDDFKNVKMTKYKLSRM